MLLQQIYELLEHRAGCLKGTLDYTTLVLGHKSVNCILNDPGILESIGYLCADILTEDFLGLSLCSLLALLPTLSLRVTLGQLFV